MKKPKGLNMRRVIMHDIGGLDMSDEERQWIADDISASLIAARDRSIKEATGLTDRELTNFLYDGQNPKQVLVASETPPADSIDNIAAEANKGKGRPEDPDKRNTLKTLGKLAFGFSLGGLAYKVGRALAEDAAAQAAAAPDYQLPSDEILLKYMSQPVETTLNSMGRYSKERDAVLSLTDKDKVLVQYVNDNNYQKEVLGSDKPVMVLFYVDLKTATGVNPSRGLAALTRVLAERFPQIKLCAYKLSNGERTPQHVLNTIGDKYPLKDPPAILFYDNDNGKIEFLASCDGGIITLDFLKNKAISNYFKAIPKYMLD